MSVMTASLAARRWELSEKRSPDLPDDLFSRRALVGRYHANCSFANERALGKCPTDFMPERTLRHMGDH